MKDYKYVLKADIKQKLLASRGLIGQIADLSFDAKGKKLEYMTIRARILNDSPIVTTAESVAIIKKVLNIPDKTTIYERIQIGSPELHHE